MELSTNRLRIWRLNRGYSLGKVCELLARQGVPRPSTAKLSRIERDQKVPLDMLDAFVTVTRIPARALRPEIARLFLKRVATRKPHEAGRGLPSERDTRQSADHG